MMSDPEIIHYKQKRLFEENKGNKGAIIRFRNKNCLKYKLKFEDFLQRILWFQLKNHAITKTYVSSINVSR